MGGGQSSWVTVKLGDVIRQVSKRNKLGYDYDVYSVSNTKGFISQDNQFKNKGSDVASSDRSNYKIVEYNQFGYNPARINVGSIARLKEHKSIVISPMYVVFETTDKILPEYMEYWLQSYEFKNNFDRYLEGSVRSMLKYDGLASMEISIPPIEEQHRIASVLSTFDSLLEQIESEELNISSQKQAIMAKIFNIN